MTETVLNSRKTPCHNCRDRYTACSDHCQKPEFLAWKKERQTIRENRRKYKALWGYTAEAAEKNRRRR